MKRYLIGVIIALIVLPQVFAKPQISNENKEIRGFIQQLFNDNAAFSQSLTKREVDTIKKSQSPKATVVLCSDSRVQNEAFHRSPVNELFVIRNIGNQIITAEGSVEYGIYHLNTPVLLIVGHSYCGAVKAAMHDFGNELPAIQHELAQLHLKHSKTLDNAIVENVHQQVTYALQKFQDKIKDKKLIVIGAVYDFRNDFGHGYGRLFLVDVNGETHPEKIKKLALIKNLKEVNIGVNLPKN